MYISLPSSRRSHFPRCPKTMTRYKYINDLYRSYMCAHPHALSLGLGDGYHIPLWPNNADLSLYILDGSLTVYIRLDCICIKCQTWLFFPFFSVFLSLFHAQKNKKTKHCRIPCIVVWCIILVGAWQAMSYVAVASHGGQTIHSNLNVSVNRKDASFWRSNGIQPHERGGEMYTKIYGRREKWETGRIKRLVGSYLESDELWLLEREWMTYRSLKLTLERQWDRHLGCEASWGIRFRQRPTSRGKETNKTTKNKKWENGRRFKRRNEWRREK